MDVLDKFLMDQSVIPLPMCLGIRGGDRLYEG